MMTVLPAKEIYAALEREFRPWDYSTEKYAVMEMVKFFEGLGLESEFLPVTPNFEEL